MATIGIFDSGSGGLSVLREVKKLIPGARYVYYADNAFCPYGGKTPGQIQERCRAITAELVDAGAEVIVVACNTATGAAIAMLRETFDIPFVGMEPAVKPAALQTKSGVIGVLATEGTLHASKYLMTKGRFEGDVRIEERVGRGFVELVESMELEGSRAEAVVAASLVPLLEAGADNIVLGCTHYPFLLPVMKKVAARTPHLGAFSSEVNFIDPAPAVARQLKNVLQQAGIAEESGNPGVELRASGSRDTLERLFRLI